MNEQLAKKKKKELIQNMSLFRSELLVFFVQQLSSIDLKS